MKTYLAFLKGINVGGHHKILMKDLRDLLNNLGFKDVKTYIQSGNVIFKTEIKDKTVVEKQITTAIKNKYNYNIQIIVKQPKEVQAILDNSPFIQEKTQESYFFIL